MAWHVHPAFPVELCAPLQQGAHAVTSEASCDTHARRKLAPLLCKAVPALPAMLHELYRIAKLMLRFEAAICSELLLPGVLLNADLVDWLHLHACNRDP